MAKQPQTSRRKRSKRARAFTLIEVLVSIGAAALVAVGIAAIFESVGKTVTGGKRLSQFNSYAALLEQQLREDFSKMTRDGFFLIRQQYAGLSPGGSVPTEPPDVALTADDTAPRPRRVDELLFFANGEFTTAREPMHPSFIARASAARIYYGHGARMSPANPAHARPEMYNRPNTGDTTWVPGLVGPNQFAGEWTLLRHVALLSPTRTAPSYPALPPPGTLFGRHPVGGARASDQATQVALQPAAPSLFRQLNARVYPLPNPGGPAITTVRTIRGDFAAYSQNPLFSSGLVDICTTSLAEVRTFVTSLPEPPARYTTGASWASALPAEGMLYDNSLQLDGPLDRQHQWMDQAWPTQSDPTLNANPPADPVPGARMRYETAPPDYLGVLSQIFTRPEEEQFRRIDQSMLTASNLLPRCTEFIVEWSFGQIDDQSGSPTFGQLIWYGLDRPVDLDGDGQTMGPRDGYAARPYPYKATVAGSAIAPFRMPYRRVDGKIADGAPAVPPATVANPPPVVVRQELINGVEVTGLPDPVRPLTNYFGYVDPTFNPVGPDGAAGWQGTGSTATNDDPATPPAWPWPRLIRVTVTIADERDPKIEETFQFVIETPGNPAP